MKQAIRTAVVGAAVLAGAWMGGGQALAAPGPTTVVCIGGAFGHGYSATLPSALAAQYLAAQPGTFTLGACPPR